MDLLVFCAIWIGESFVLAILFRLLKHFQIIDDSRDGEAFLICILWPFIILCLPIIIIFFMVSKIIGDD